MPSIEIGKIVFDSSIYPREKPSSSTISEYADALIGGAKFPPIVLEEGTNRLLDGYHRWKAYASVDGVSEIECEFHKIPEGITASLYALSLSSRNGMRPSTKEKKLAAQRQYKDHPGTPNKVIAQLAGVSAGKVAEYIAPLIAEFEETKRSVIMRLNFLGWTQQEVSDKLQDLWPDAKGMSQPSIVAFLSENEKFEFLIKSDLTKGLEPKTVAQRYALPEVLAWAIKLQDISDPEKMDELGIKVQPYDHWNFQGCGDLFGAEYPGRIPGELVAHVLYFFTEPGGMVLDPMAGSGTTLDVCLAMGRQCYAYDIDNRSARFDVLKHDMKDGWPERVKKAGLIFWDPPYFEKKMEEYIEGSISDLGRDEYLDFFARRLREAAEHVKPKTKLAFLMSDWNDESGEREGVFIWDYAKIIQDAGWKLLRHIQVPLSTQQVHPDIVNKFRAARRLARLERYLLIAER